MPERIFRVIKEPSAFTNRKDHRHWCFNDALILARKWADELGVDEIRFLYSSEGQCRVDHEWRTYIDYGFEAQSPREKQMADMIRDFRAAQD